MEFEFKLPDIGEGVVEGEIVRWMVSAGDQIQEDQPMVEVMTDKATVEIPSPVEGVVVQTVGGEGDTVEVGATMLVIETSSPVTVTEAVKVAHAEEAEVGKPAKKMEARKPARVLATPAIRKLAREKGVDLSSLEGSGPGGRITREDVEKAVIPQPDVEPAAEVEAETEIPYRGLRKKIGDHLVAAKRFAPHYTYVEEADVTELVALREAYQKVSPGSGLNYLPFLIKAVVEGLKKHPVLNSTLDEDKRVIRVRHSYNIGIATATDEGLVVPVVKNADRKSVLELAEEIFRLTERTKQGKVRLEDIRDGTFTVTSLGALGGVMATPIINYPEVGILGVHKIEARPVVVEGQIVIRQRMNLSLSLDHRVVDGIIGARFIQTILPYIENPGWLAIQ